MQIWQNHGIFGRESKKIQNLARNTLFLPNLHMQI
jgi:hypothetical protein